MFPTATSKGGCPYTLSHLPQDAQESVPSPRVTDASRLIFIYIFLKATSPLSSSSCQALPLIPQRFWHLPLMLPLHTCAHAEQLWTKVDTHRTMSRLEPVMIFGILLQFSPAMHSLFLHPALLTLHLWNYHTRPSVQHFPPWSYTRTTGSPNPAPRPHPLKS